MSGGYIYILINESFGGLIKIGSTTLGAQQRAKQLSSNTSVPTPFAVAYEVYVENCKKLEKELHGKLEDFRVNSNREFFKYPLNLAIQLITQLRLSNKYETTDKYQAVEILRDMKNRFSKNLREDISSIRIYQDNERVYFEFTRDEYKAGYLKNQYTTRTDLGFIADDIDIKTVDCVFKSSYPIEQNVRMLLSLDDFSMLNCIGEIFADKWIPHEMKS